MHNIFMRKIPDRSGYTAIVTGTGGIGFEIALALAGAGADVILAGRNPEEGNNAVSRILAACPGASEQASEPASEQTSERASVRFE